MMLKILWRCEPVTKENHLCDGWLVRAYYPKERSGLADDLDYNVLIDKELFDLSSTRQEWFLLTELAYVQQGFEKEVERLMAVDGWHTYRAQPVMRRDTLVEYVDNKDETRIDRADQIVWHFVKRWRTHKPDVDAVLQSK